MNRFIDRELVILATLVAVTMAVFLGTRRFAAANDLMRRRDAEAWYAIGDGALKKGDVHTAVPAFRRAAAKNPDDAHYRRTLAAALMASHDDDAALQLLLDLHDQRADDAETDLQLARLEARRGDRPAAGRYYQTAIVALWRAAERPARQEVRREFIKFLLEHGERDRALSELLVLETGLSQDVPSQVSAATMLLAAGDARRALDHFDAALRVSPSDVQALSGAAESSFELGDYARTQRYLRHIAADSDRTRELRAVTTLVLTGDPLMARLPIAERRRRLADWLSHVLGRLETCQMQAIVTRPETTADLDAVLTEARTLDAAVASRSGFRSSDDVEAAFEVVYRGTRAADRICDSSAPRDRALRLIGRRHGLEPQ